MKHSNVSYDQQFWSDYVMYFTLLGKPVPEWVQENYNNQINDNK